VQLNKSWGQWGILKVEGSRLKDIGTKLFPCVTFGENGVTEGSRTVAAFFGVSHFEDELHNNRILGLISPASHNEVTERQPKGKTSSGE